MKVTDFTHLLEHPKKVTNPLQTKQLEDIIEEYPYFQAARAIHLKGLKNLNSYKYNKALKITAAYTADRDVLFDFITSKDFLNTTTKNHYKKVLSLHTNAAIEKNKEEAEYKLQIEIPNTRETSKILSDTKTALIDSFNLEEINTQQTLATPQKSLKVAVKSEPLLGTPLSFNEKEKHSFREWLQLTSKKPLSRSFEEPAISPKEEKPPIKQKASFDKVDKFILSNPKIVPREHTAAPTNITASATLNKNELMTETLARVYLEQKKYKEAIQAYKILSLKYPKKSSSFVDRIKYIQNLQQENKVSK